MQLCFSYSILRLIFVLQSISILSAFEISYQNMVFVKTTAQKQHPFQLFGAAFWNYIIRQDSWHFKYWRYLHADWNHLLMSAPELWQTLFRTNDYSQPDIFSIYSALSGIDRLTQSKLPRVRCSDLTTHLVSWNYATATYFVRIIFLCRVFSLSYLLCFNSHSYAIVI